jgi:uncharacterized damage-inducible protein DinB
MSQVQSFIAEFDQENKNTRRMLERYPSGKDDWKPHAKSFSLTGLTGHLCTLSNFATAIASHDKMDMKKGDYKPFYPKTSAEALARFDEEAAKAREALGKLSDADLAKIWSFAFEGNELFAMPRMIALRSFFFNHLIHHRGQLTVYYRLNDVAVPGLYGPSADEPM